MRAQSRPNLLNSWLGLGYYLTSPLLFDLSYYFSELHLLNQKIIILFYYFSTFHHFINNNNIIINISDDGPSPSPSPIFFTINLSPLPTSDEFQCWVLLHFMSSRFCCY